MRDLDANRCRAGRAPHQHAVGSKLLVPTIIHLMLGMGDQLWGDACYPVVD